jgi:uncharacterized protein YndB with AHSA1/START domain
MSTDRIEKEIQLTAPLARVWRALTDTQEFGQWFQVKIEGTFVPGKTVRGQITTRGYEHLTVDFIVLRMQEPQLFSYRWHPGAVDAKDVADEPTTLVEFHLEKSANGTRLRIVESGFEHIPLARRAEAFRMNNEGWGAQAENIARYVAQS